MKKLGNRFWALLFYGLACNVGNVIFFPVMFYAPFQTVFQLTNTQIGNLTAAYASLAIPAYLVSGIIADKVNSKLLMMISTISSTAVIFIMAIIPPYPVLLACFFVLSITLGLFFWSSSSKLRRMLGEASEQGTISGVIQCIDGIVSLGFMVGLVALLGDSLSTASGMRTLLITFGILYTISTIGFIVTYDYKKFSELYVEDHGEPVRMKNYLIGLKMPVTWITSLMCFGVYITSTAFNYINPYMASQYAMSASMAAIFGILLRYGIKIVVTPVGGIIRDRINNTTKMIVATALPTLILVIVFMFLPRGAGFTVLAVAVALILNCTYRMGNNLSMMPIAELNVPLNLLGVISGLTLFFGYFSDWFLPSLIGHWMDTKGDNAYYYVFSVAVVGLFLFILGALWLKKELKRMESGRAAS
ncbi:MFS transporter [Clostridium sp. chh4-2]|uniref:MFS transporter n=1 Tax=Clostridium sp. chh4-2 TaxID=2067550 RepID=UPI000CCE22E6|nr:MFS transporter [Clostridium sp. chh4-2]PNV62746.1 MFS transporter [Clostridium sp. chh4-2]